MTDTTAAVDTAAPAKKTRKASGPRVSKPMFAIVTGATDANGNPVQLDRAHLTITLERDPAKIVDLLSGDAAGAVVVRANMPEVTKTAK